MTRLRKMMLEELQRRNYSAITTRNYLRVVTEFAKHFGKSPDKLGPNELRTYQAYLLTERKLTPGTVVNRVAALRFFFVKTLKRHQFREFLPYPRDRRRLPTVLSQEEVSQLINGAGNLFRRTLLMTLYGTGMRRAELARLKVGDIDSLRMIIRVVAGKGRKDRDLPIDREGAQYKAIRGHYRGSTSTLLGRASTRPSAIHMCPIACPKPRPTRSLVSCGALLQCRVHLRDPPICRETGRYSWMEGSAQLPAGFSSHWDRSNMTLQ